MRRYQVVLHHKSVFIANKVLEVSILDLFFSGNKDEALPEIEKMGQID